MAPIDEIYNAAHALKEAGDIEGAVKKLLEGLELDPNHVETHAALANYYQRLHKADEAISHAKKVAELNPNEHYSWMQLSIICQRCGKIEEAEVALAKAKEIAM